MKAIVQFIEECREIGIDVWEGIPSSFLVFIAFERTDQGAVICSKTKSTRYPVSIKSQPVHSVFLFTDKGASLLQGGMSLARLRQVECLETTGPWTESFSAGIFLDRVMQLMAGLEEVQVDNNYLH